MFLKIIQIIVNVAKNDLINISIFLGGSWGGVGRAACLQPPLKSRFRPASGSPRIGTWGPRWCFSQLPPSVLICILHRCFQLIVRLQQCRLMRCVVGEPEAPGSVIVILALAGGIANTRFIFCVQLSCGTQEQNSSCDHREQSL